MYKIDEKDNSIIKVERSAFSELGYHEREHLQEWIAKNSDVLGEDLLIIQKEFSGFLETNERLDLLALDKYGNIVVIENKLDDSGKDVIWQVLKYASYCSQLTKDNIKDLYQDYLLKNGSQLRAEDALTEFFATEEFEELQLNIGNTQRIIMVAAKFRKEITSTVLWLMNYKLRIQCFKVTPYITEGERYVNFEQIIPVKDIEDYMITMADKAQSETETHEREHSRYRIRQAFWQKYIAKANERLDLYKNVSASKDNWISGATGITATGFNSVITKNHARVELYMSRAVTEENKLIFDELFQMKDSIEKQFGPGLVWERLNDKKASRIRCQLEGVNYFDEDDWPEMIDFMVDALDRLALAFRKPLKEVRQKLLKNIGKVEG